jgi:uncharacterized protein
MAESGVRRLPHRGASAVVVLALVAVNLGQHLLRAAW